MEIKAELKKPYTKEQKNDFIIKYSHKCALEITENKEGLIAFERKLTNEDKINAIKFKLSEIDLKSIRALRCQEQDRLTLLESEAIKLRQELNELMKGEKNDN